MSVFPEEADEQSLPRALDAAVLLSTLSVAAEWMGAYQARRAGRDPSDQQPHDVAQHEGHQACADLADLSLRLVASLTLEGERGAAALLRRLDQMLVLRRMGHVLTRLHQHLLSLYPAVSEELLEAAREATGARAALAAREGEAFCDAAATFASDVLRLVRRVREETA